jgi:hypothetical protein
MPSQARSDLPARSKGLEGIAVVRISNNAMMPDYKIVAIPYDYWRNSAQFFHPASKQEKRETT